MRPGSAGAYLDTCVLVSLFHNDSGYAAAEAWLATATERPLWISHWVLLEFATATAVRCRRGELAPGKVAVIESAVAAFQRERLGLLEPRGEHFLLARGWVQRAQGPTLRGADALHLALAHRQGLRLVSADRALVEAAGELQIPAELVGGSS